MRDGLGWVEQRFLVESSGLLGSLTLAFEYGLLFDSFDYA